MYNQTNIADLAPQILERAIEHQCAALPDDRAALDRLWTYIKMQRPKLREIKEAILEFYLIEPSELCGANRAYEVSLARQIFCYLAYHHTRFSMDRIAKEVGVHDHTTVRHAVRKITKHSISRPLLRDDLDLLLLRIGEKVLLRTNASC
jgi:chromosomal replication initiation ATPase DnaA